VKRWVVLLDRVLYIHHMSYKSQAIAARCLSPMFKGRDGFTVYCLCHSSQFKGVSTTVKKAIRVGCWKFGHDFAQALYEHEYDFIIVQ